MSESNPMHYDAEDVGGVTVVRVTTRELRHPPQAIEFGRQLRELVDRHGRTRLVVDLGHTRYMCSTGFGTLLTLARDLGASGGRLALCRLHPDVLIGARIIGMEQFAPIFDDEQGAIDAASA